MIAKPGDFPFTAQQARVLSALAAVEYPGYEWLVGDEGRGAFLRAAFDAVDRRTGQVERQYTRAWSIDPQATVGEIVQTALKCVLTSVEHEAREAFTYRGKAIFGPHIDIEALVSAQGSKR